MYNFKYFLYFSPPFFFEKKSMANVYCPWALFISSPVTGNKKLRLYLQNEHAAIDSGSVLEFGNCMPRNELEHFAKESDIASLIATHYQDDELRSLAVISGAASNSLHVTTVDVSIEGPDPTNADDNSIAPLCSVPIASNVTVHVSHSPEHEDTPELVHLDSALDHKSAVFVEAWALRHGDNLHVLRLSARVRTADLPEQSKQRQMVSALGIQQYICASLEADEEQPVGLPIRGVGRAVAAGAKKAQAAVKTAARKAASGGQKAGAGAQRLARAGGKQASSLVKATQARATQLRASRLGRSLEGTATKQLARAQASVKTRLTSMQASAKKRVETLQASALKKRASAKDWLAKQKLKVTSGERSRQFRDKVTAAATRVRAAPGQAKAFAKKQVERLKAQMAKLKGGAVAKPMGLPGGGAGAAVLGGAGAPLPEETVASLAELPGGMQLPARAAPATVDPEAVAELERLKEAGEITLAQELKIAEEGMSRATLAGLSERALRRLVTVSPSLAAATTVAPLPTYTDAEKEDFRRTIISNRNVILPLDELEDYIKTGNSRTGSGLPKNPPPIQETPNVEPAAPFAEPAIQFAETPKPQPPSVAAAANANEALRDMLYYLISQQSKSNDVMRTLATTDIKTAVDKVASDLGSEVDPIDAVLCDWICSAEDYVCTEQDEQQLLGSDTNTPDDIEDIGYMCDETSGDVPLCVALHCSRVYADKIGEEQLYRRGLYGALEEAHALWCPHDTRNFEDTALSHVVEEISEPIDSYNVEHLYKVSEKWATNLIREVYNPSQQCSVHGVSCDLFQQ